MVWVKVSKSRGYHGSLLMSCNSFLLLYKTYLGHTILTHISYTAFIPLAIPSNPVLATTGLTLPASLCLLSWWVVFSGPTPTMGWLSMLLGMFLHRLPKHMGKIKTHVWGWFVSLAQASLSRGISVGWKKFGGIDAACWTYKDKCCYQTQIWCPQTIGHLHMVTYHANVCKTGVFEVGISHLWLAYTWITYGYFSEWEMLENIPTGSIFGNIFEHRHLEKYPCISNDCGTRSGLHHLAAQVENQQATCWLGEDCWCERWFSTPICLIKSFGGVSARLFWQRYLRMDWSISEMNGIPKAHLTEHTSDWNLSSKQLS